MKPLQSLLQFSRPTVISVRSERDEQLRHFEKKIQLRDKKTKDLRDATLEELALILRHCPTSDLYAFYQQCSQAKTFGKYFWWAVKKKTKPVKVGTPQLHGV